MDVADTKHVLKKYLSADRTKKDPEWVNTLLNRYVLPWACPITLFDGAATPVTVRQAGLETSTDEPVLCFSSVVRGNDSDPILAKVRKMATLPLFYRLNHIRQLSTTHLAISLDGTHNRLAHCLGTLDVASRFLTTLKQTIRIEDVESKAVLVYAFLHDCYHGPMGHTLDLVRDVIWGPFIDERIDKHLLLVHIDEGLKKRTGDLWRAVLTCVAENSTECERIFSYLQSFLELGDKEKGYLAEIVDGDLDADRLDYIWRDHVHLNMSSVDSRLIDGLITSARVIEQDGARHLSFSSEYARFVETLLDLRVQFYAAYYENPLKQIADDMLAHVLYYVLKTEAVLDTPLEREKFAERFAYLTDDGLLGFLTEITSRPEHDIAHVVFEDFRSNRPFVIVEKMGLHREKLGMLSLRVAALNTELRRIQDEEKERLKDLVHRQKVNPLGLFERGLQEKIISRFNSVVGEPVPIEADRGHPEWAGAVIPYDKEEDVYRIQLYYGDSFLKKLELERLLWEALLDKKTGKGVIFRDALLPIVERLEERGFRTRRELQDLIVATPLVFITLSWIPGVGEDALLAHQKGYRRNSIRFHRNGRPDESQAELTVKPRDEDYYLIVSAPSILLRAEGMRELIRGTFNEILVQRKWIPMGGPGS